MDLYEACENGNEERVVELLLGSTDDGAARLHARRGAVGGSTMANTVSHDRSSINRPGASPSAQLRQRGTAGRTALLAACMGGQAGVVRLLLGESCTVYFTSRSRQETLALLAPLTPVGSSCDVHMVTKDDGVELVPMATVRFPPQWIVAPQELLEARVHVDDFGNTPLQCVSCFGCGSVTRHVDDGLVITRQLLLHGDQPNVPKHVSKWTPLHWSAYHGNHEQAALLLDPQTHVGGGQRRFGHTQIAIPLLTDVDGLFPVDIAGRRGLALREEMAALRQRARSGQQDAHSAWRLRLDHVEVVRLLVREFLRSAAHLTRYVSEMNARRPIQTSSSSQTQQKCGILRVDAVRYGQHLLYWSGCFGLQDELQALLRLRLQDGAVTKTLAGSQENEQRRLWTLHACSCEVDKRQSVLHAAAALGQLDIVLLLLDELLLEQREESSAGLSPSASASKRGGYGVQFKRKRSIVVPSAKEASTSVQEHDKPQDDRLDVLALLHCGWLSQRNETPLFLAALFLRQSVVQALVRVLSVSSLAWELRNCNLEGSSLQDIASDAAREVLGLDAHPPAHAEYVLLFDGLHKRAFKESLIDTMREESALAPSLVATRAGSREIRAAGRFRSQQQTDYVVVGATDDVLVRHAQTLQLKVKHRGTSVRSQFDAGALERFEPLRSLQRQQVVLSIVQLNLNLQKHLRLGNLRAVFPLHDAPGCRNIVRHWVYTDLQKHIYQTFEAASLRQFLLERREHPYEMLWPLLTYFGEKHAFYYAFGAFYTAWLLLLAVPGAVCQLLWLVDSLHFLSPLFAVAVSIWATLLVERWKRKRSEIQRNFGHFRRNRSEQAPGFYGDFQPDTTHTAVDVSFPRSLQLVRIYSGMFVLITVGVGAVAVFVAVKTVIATSILIQQALPWLPTVLVPYAVPFFNAVAMLLLDNVYTRLARALTGWENHRTVWQFESMLAAKLFWFKFLNAFMSLFWVAFVEQDAATLRQQLLMIMGVRQLWNSAIRDVLPLVHVRYRWKQAGFRFVQPPSAFATPRTTFWSVAGREWYNAAPRCPPPSASSTDEDQVEKAEAETPPSEVLLQELMYPPDFLMGKQMETVLQFGYITMFVSVLPVAPLLALLSNVVATRLDVLSCVQVKQRPPFESETEVTTFMNILEFMSFAAVAVNCAVLFFTTRSEFESLLRVLAPDLMNGPIAALEHSPEFYLKELWVLLAIEHVVLGAKALLSLTIDDSASWVRADEDRSSDDEKKVLEDRRAGSVGFKDLGPQVGEGNRELPLVLSSRSNERFVDRLLADVVSAPVDSTTSGSALQRILLDKYMAAVRERNAALQREQVVHQKLVELSRATGSLSAGKAVESGVADKDDSGPAEDGTEVTDSVPTGDQGGGLASNRWCFICYALRNIELPAERRCLSCHTSVCFACDVILHLDDLGVKEATHFRVNIPVSVTTVGMSSAPKTADLDVYVRLEASDPQQKRQARAKQHKETKAEVLLELRRLVEAFVTRGRPTALLLSSREAYQRCVPNASIALRYLRNHERQRKHMEGPAHRELQ